MFVMEDLGAGLDHAVHAGSRPGAADFEDANAGAEVVGPVDDVGPRVAREDAEWGEGSAAALLFEVGVAVAAGAVFAWAVGERAPDPRGHLRTHLAR